VDPVPHLSASYGFSRSQRTNEDNVDLNRNFVDFSMPLPKNPGYQRFHGLLVP